MNIYIYIKQRKTFISQTGEFFCGSLKAPRGSLVSLISAVLRIRIIVVEHKLRRAKLITLLCASLRGDPDKQNGDPSAYWAAIFPRTSSRDSPPPTRKSPILYFGTDERAGSVCVIFHSVLFAISLSVRECTLFRLTTVSSRGTIAIRRCRACTYTKNSGREYRFAHRLRIITQMRWITGRTVYACDWQALWFIERSMRILMMSHAMASPRDAMSREDAEDASSLFLSPCF